MLGGLGLFLVGVWLLSESMKTLANRRLRVLAASWMPNRFAAAGWGVFAAMILQTMPALTFIAVSMKQTRLASTQRAFSIILGGNVGATLLLLIVTLDIKILALYALGVSGVTMMSERTRNFREPATALFGLAMLFIGLVLIREHAAPLADDTWFSEVFTWMERSLWFSFLGAIALTLIVQSSVLVIALAVSLASVGIMTIDQAIMVAFGSNIGSSLVLLLLSANLTGTSRQIAMYQVAFNFVACLVFIPIFLLELNTGIFLLKAAAIYIDIGLSHQVVMFTILFTALTSLLLLVFVNPTIQLWERLWPATKLEEMSNTKFIHDHALGDLDMAMRLVDLEQRRLPALLSEYFVAVRREERIDELREATRALISRIGEFLEDAKPRYQTAWKESFNAAFIRQKLFTWLEEQLGELCRELNLLSRESTLGGLKSSFVEGIDTVLLILNEELSTGDEDSWSQVAELTGDRNEFLGRTRTRYLSESAGLDKEEQAGLLNITNNVEQIFFLLSKLTEGTQSSRARTEEPASG